MTSLIHRSPASSFGELLKLRSSPTGMSTSLVVVEDGHGTACPLQISTTTIALNNLIWPTSGAQPGKLLSVAANNQLAWVDVTPDARYDLAFSSNGIAPAGKVFLFTTSRAFSLPGSLTGSVASSLIAAATTTAFKLYKKVSGGSSSQIGTITFSAGASVGTFSGTGTAFAIGDMFYVDLQTADSALSDVAVTLLASLT